MRRNRTHLSIVAVLVAVSTVLTYFVLTAIYQLPEAASVQAGSIDTMFNAHFIMISFLFSLIVVFMLYSFVVFRRKPGDEGDGVHFHGHTGLEIVWTIVPLVMVISFGVWGAFTLNDITRERTDEMVVQVTGRQWSWLFEYPEIEGMGPTDELVLPVNRNILLEMNSNDVLHSFWVPEFRVKQDLVPGQTTSLRITPTEEGAFKLRCAEICGERHANMLANVRVVSEQTFDQWVSERSVSLASLTPVERGQKFATDYGCTGCHSVDGSQLAGPTWLGLSGKEETMEDGSTVVVDETYLRESILDPGAQIVAGYQNLMSALNFADRFAADEPELSATSGIEIDIAADLISYIQSLSE